jgi:hypothetical protein
LINCTRASFAHQNASGGLRSRRTARFRSIRAIEEHAMISMALERTLAVYGQMVSHPTEEAARENLSAYLTEQFNRGEQDQQRLTVLGLTYLRGMDRGL